MECARYAMQVCPFLAAPKYAAKAKTERLNARPDLPEHLVVIKNEAIDDGRPDLFALGCATRYVVVPGQYSHELLMQSDDWTHVETWWNGQMVEVLPLPIKRT
jgi:hypothetical protein